MALTPKQEAILGGIHTKITGIVETIDFDNIQFDEDGQYITTAAITMPAEFGEQSLVHKVNEIVVTFKFFKSTKMTVLLQYEPSLNANVNVEDVKDLSHVFLHINSSFKSQQVEVELGEGQYITVTLFAAPLQEREEKKPLYQVKAKPKTLRDADITLLEFDVGNTISIIEKIILAELNAEHPNEENDDQIELAQDRVEVTIEMLRNDPQYRNYRKKLLDAEACMEEFNTKTRGLSRELVTELDKENSQITGESAQAIAQAQRNMITDIARILSDEDDNKEVRIRAAGETFIAAYNKNFPQRKNDRIKAVGWGVGVGLAMAAVGVGLSFLAFFALPFVPGIEMAASLFSPNFFITLGSVAGGLGASGALLAIRTKQNHYVYDAKVRDAISSAKNSAINTAFLLNKLGFVNKGKEEGGDLTVEEGYTNRDDQPLLDDAPQKTGVRQGMRTAVSHRLWIFQQNVSEIPGQLSKAASDGWNSLRSAVSL